MEPILCTDLWMYILSFLPLKQIITSQSINSCYYQWIRQAKHQKYMLGLVLRSYRTIPLMNSSLYRFHVENTTLFIEDQVYVHMYNQNLKRQLWYIKMERNGMF